MGKKEKYYKLDNILAKNCEYNVILGERSNGKSFAVKSYCIAQFLKEGDMFVYLRRWDLDVKKKNVDKYFSDAALHDLIRNWSHGRYDSVVFYSGDLYLATTQPDGDIVRKVKCGYVVSLSADTHFKSLNLPEVGNIIFEEFVTKTMYLDDEITAFFSIISTVARRKMLKVWLIGNTISRLCPYFAEWSLTHVPKQKQGTIDIYHQKTKNDHIINIAVELCTDIVEKSMVFGKSASMANSGEWECDSYPNLPYNYREYELCYSAAVEKYNMRYMIELLRHNSIYVAYVHTIKNTIPAKCKRLITDNYSDNPLQTKYLTVVTKGDNILLRLIKNYKVCYSDNLTGTEFNTLLEGGDLI